MDLARAPRRAPLTARKKGSGYENGLVSVKISELYIYIWSKNFSHSVNEKSEAK